MRVGVILCVSEGGEHKFEGGGSCVCQKEVRIGVRVGEILGVSEGGENRVRVGKILVVSEGGEHRVEGAGGIGCVRGRGE